jgi:hypothetical protein
MFSVIIPVGPADADLRRLGCLLESLRRYERPSEIQLILIDDAPSPRLGAEFGSDWGGTEIIRTPIWKDRRPDPFSAMVVGTICGICSASPGAEFLLKLDTDALIIGEFSEQLRNAFAADASLGILGSYDRTCTGTIRDWTVWVRALRRATRRWSMRSPRRIAVARQLIGDALANTDYELGAHCLGGAYAISPSLARRRDLLHWKPWIGAGISEDVVLGVLCGAAGLRMRSMTAFGEPFGLAHIGLPGPPEWLVARGHSIVHAVKNPNAEIEANIRRAFQTSALRSSPSAAPRYGEMRYGDIELRA